MEIKIDWDQEIEDIGPRLYRYFCARFSDSEAEDLTQETLIRLVRKVKEAKFDPLKGNLRMLSFGIAHYVALENKSATDLVSIDEVQESEFLIEPIEDIQLTLITKNQSEKIKESFKKLNQIEQQIMALLIEDEISLVDVGKIIQIPMGTLKSHVFRAKKKLISFIREEGIL